MGGFSGTLQVMFNLTATAPEMVRGTVGRRVHSVAQHILDTSSQSVPVDTGTLRDSGHIEDIDQMNADIVYDAANDKDHHYSAYVELGTVRTRAQPFLMPAVEQHRDELRNALSDEGL